MPASWATITLLPPVVATVKGLMTVVKVEPRESQFTVSVVGKAARLVTRLSCPARGRKGVASNPTAAAKRSVFIDRRFYVSAEEMRNNIRVTGVNTLLLICNNIARLPAEIPSGNP